MTNSDATGRGESPASPSARLGTLCVHAGWQPDSVERSLVLPVVRASTFVTDDPVYANRELGKSGPTPSYAREGGPTLYALERRLSVLEGAEAARVFSSGMAALSSLFFASLAQGEHVVASQEIYGGTEVLFDELLARIGVEVTRVDMTDLDAVRAAIQSNTTMLFCEGVSNPLLTVLDLPAIAQLAHENGAQLFVDATFTSPIGQRPIALGADAVMHSASKFLCGHSDVIAGVIAGREELIEKVHTWRTRLGGILDPEPAYLLDRGIKTLSLRVRAQTETADAIAHWLADDPRVTKVFYPGMESHPTFEVAQRVLDLPGAMLSFAVEGDKRRAVEIMRRFKMIFEAPSLGGIESMASAPAVMSHVALGAERLAQLGIPQSLVRLTVGIEDALDVMADIDQALG